MSPLPDRNPGNDSLRLFVALTLPDAVRDTLALLVQRLRGVAWTRPENLHVTMRFLGEVPVDRFDSIVERLAGIEVEPFVLPVEGVGTFPPKRPPRVLWVGVGQGHPRLHQLRQRVDDALLATGLPLDVRTFHPHVTMARCTEDAAAAVGRWLQTHRGFAAPPFRVSSFDLYESTLQRGGPVYTLKHRFPLEK
jgi:RNA 2',3'-cyclic 3'-phosphodiesterase